VSIAPLTPTAAVARIYTLLRTAFGANLPDRVDLGVMVQLLNEPAFAKGAQLRLPREFVARGFEGALVRNEGTEEWGIFYKPHPQCRERQRFTIAHEMGHFVLHRERVSEFRCDMRGVNNGQDADKQIEKEANAFASNLLMPADLFRDGLGNQQKADLNVLSGLARRFDVSLEAACLRFIELTRERAILLRWDSGILDYEARSKKAVLTKARFRNPNAMQEPMAGSVSADSGTPQCFDGIKQPAAMWCREERPHMTLRECKHTYVERDRMLTLLILESAEPRFGDTTHHDEHEEDASNQFRNSGQLPVR